MEQHHGQIVERIIRRNGHSITDIAKLTRVNRRSVYNWFAQRRLRPAVIRTIGSAIEYDFTVDIPELEKFEKEVPVKAIPEPNQENWKDKYIVLLERYNDLLTNRVEQQTV